jgi:hypothetical protein
VLDILGVVNDVPVPNEVPPVKAAYQFNVPALAVAPIVTVPVPQTEPGVVPDTVGIALTVATTALLLAVVQPLAVAST